MDEPIIGGLSKLRDHAGIEAPDSLLCAPIIASGIHNAEPDPRNLVPENSKGPACVKRGGDDESGLDSRGGKHRPE